MVWYVPFLIVIGLAIVSSPFWLSIIFNIFKKKRQADLYESFKFNINKAYIPSDPIDIIKTQYKDGVTGVFVLCNDNKKRIYLGSSIDMYNDVKHHFIGGGNSSIHTDFKFNDPMVLYFIPLSSTNYLSSGELFNSIVEMFPETVKSKKKSKLDHFILVKGKTGSED